MTVEELKVIISAETQNLEKGVNKVNNALDSVGKNSSSISGLSSLFGEAGSSAIAAAGAIGAAVIAVKAVADASIACYKAYGYQLEQEIKLTNAMKNSLGATTQQIAAVKEYAAELQKVGVVGDEVALAGANTFAQYAAGADSVKKMLPALEDMAVALNGANVSASDMESVANKIGRILSSGTLNARTLGFSISDSELAKWNTLISQTDKEDYLIQLINQHYGGLNEKMANTPTGAIARLNNAWGDLKEQLGSLLSGVLTPIINALTTIITFLNDIISLVVDAVNSFLRFIGLLGDDGTAEEIEVLADNSADIGINTGDIADNLNDANSSAGDLVKQFKKLMGFDEINNLGSLNGNGGGGSNGGGGTNGSGASVSRPSSYGSNITTKQVTQSNTIPNALNNLNRTQTINVSVNWDDSVLDDIREDINEFIAEMEDNKIDISLLINIAALDALIDKIKGYKNQVINITTNTITNSFDKLLDTITANKNPKINITTNTITNSLDALIDRVNSLVDKTIVINAEVNANTNSNTGYNHDDVLDSLLVGDDRSTGGGGGHDFEIPGRSNGFTFLKTLIDMTATPLTLILGVDELPTVSTSKRFLDRVYEAITGDKVISVGAKETTGFVTTKEDFDALVAEAEQERTMKVGVTTVSKNGNTFSSVKKLISDTVAAVKNKSMTVSVTTAKKDGNTFSSVKKLVTDTVAAVKSKTMKVTATENKDSKGDTLSKIKARIDEINTLSKKPITLTFNLAAAVSDIKAWINDGIIAKLNNALNQIYFQDYSGSSLFGKPVYVPRRMFSNNPIPKLARGGIATSATLAEIGEAGKEAVLPLEKNTNWMDALADKLATKVNNNDKPLNLELNIGGTRFGKACISAINQAQTQSGAILLNI